MEIKQFEYAPGAFVEFVLRANEVIYCGINDIKGLPENAATTNAAGAIMQALAKIMNRPVEELEFFEFSTHWNWTALAPGQYDFEKLSFQREWKISAGAAKRSHSDVLRKRILLPPDSEIVALFQHRIGGSGTPEQYVTPHGEDAFGQPFSSRRDVEREIDTEDDET